MGTFLVSLHYILLYLEPSNIFSAQKHQIFYKLLTAINNEGKGFINVHFQMKRAIIVHDSFIVS